MYYLVFYIYLLSMVFSTVLECVILFLLIAVYYSVVMVSPSFVYPFIDWVVSTFVQLQIMLKWIFTCNSFCLHKFSVLLGRFLGVELQAVCWTMYILTTKVMKIPVSLLPL